MNLLQDSSLQSLVEQGYFSSSNFELLDIIDENITLPQIEASMADVLSIIKTISDNLPQAFDLFEKITTLKKEYKSLEIKSKSFRWGEAFVLSALVFLFACGILMKTLSFIPQTDIPSPINIIIGAIGSFIVLSIMLKSFINQYKQAQAAKMRLPQVKIDIDTYEPQLLVLKKEMLINDLSSIKTVSNNLDTLWRFLTKLKLVLSDQTISRTDQLLAINSLFANLQKQKNDRLVLAATLETAAYARRQAEAAERQERYAREAMAQQTSALVEQNRRLEEQTKVIKEKARLDELRRHNGEPWRF